MVMFIEDNGMTVIIGLVMDNVSIKITHTIKDNGDKTKELMVNKFMQMDRSIQENGKKIKNMEMESMWTEMDRFIKENGGRIF